MMSSASKNSFISSFQVFMTFILLSCYIFVAGASCLIEHVCDCCELILLLGLSLLLTVRLIVVLFLVDVLYQVE